MKAGIVITWISVFILFGDTSKLLGAIRGHGVEEESDPPEVALGEKLFRETRFGQYFWEKSGGDVNGSLPQGDPVTDYVISFQRSLVNPYRGRGINCASCHLVDELQSERDGGSRSYTDFVSRSKIPFRDGDFHQETARNSPSMVDATLPRKQGILLHYDGEFASGEGLVKGTLTGRNYGWFPSEEKSAIAQVARVIREDRGMDYQKLFFSEDRSLPENEKLPVQYRLDVTRANDQQIFDQVAKLIGAYMDSLKYARNSEDEHVGSPYDRFLEKNHLPKNPESHETPLQYSDRLLERLDHLDNPSYVSANDGSFQLHEQKFEFGPKELTGLKVFLRRPVVADRGKKWDFHVGNCSACHTPPHFSDFSFHNIGTSQEEYDSVHGRGAFAQIYVPAFHERREAEARFLPASAQYPDATAMFREPPSHERPGHADLGVWNILGNSSVPEPQESLKRQLCETWFPEVGDHCSVEQLLPKAVAAFKTPLLRDLGHSAPYFHHGRHSKLENVMVFYFTFSEKARQGLVRNADPEMSRVMLDGNDLQSLAAFLKALNEDYR